MKLQPKITQYRKDMDYRAEVSLYIGFFLNMGFVVLKLGSGILYRSRWLVAVGIYYFLIGGIRFLLLRDARATGTLGQTERRTKEYMAYRRTGWLLLVLDAAILGMAVPMVVENQSYRYHGMFIYASAAFTFYFFGLAVANVYRFRRRSSPLLLAAKAISFVSALMSMFVLQTALLTAFDEGGPFRQIINAISGAVVFTLVIYTAIRMIVRGTKMLREQKTT